MSGGYFDTATRYHISEDIETLVNIIKNNDSEELDDYGERKYYGYDKQTVEIFKITESLLRTTNIYLKHVDYLLSGDHSEDSMMKRIAEDLQEMVTDPEVIGHNDLIVAMNELAIEIEKERIKNENS